MLKIIAITAIGVAAASSALASPIATTLPSTEARVSTRGVDFNDPGAVKAFYDKVRVAARAACDSNSLSPWVARADETCREAAINAAVKQLDRPELTAMYDRSGRDVQVYSAGRD